MEIVLNGEAGKIQANYYKVKDKNKNVAVVFHDHPQFDASMDDKISYALFHAFATQGFNTLRFNYRGIGTSNGTFSNGEDELSDAANVLDWIQKNNEDANKIIIVGVGFGAWVGLQMMMRRPEITNFVAISPSVKLYDFSFVNPCSCSGLVTYGLEDKVIKEDNIRKFVAFINKQKGVNADLKIIKDADHRYEGKLKDLHQAVSLYIKQIL